MMLRVLGSGDPFGSGGRNQSAYLVETGARRILLDCGAATVASLKKLRVDTARIDLVLLTHFHGDHVAGLPFLFHDYQHVTRRRAPLRVAGPRGVRRRVEEIYRALFPGGRRRRFRVEYRTLQADRPFRPAGMRDLRILPFRVRHQESAAGFGYILEAGGRRLVYSGDTGWFEGLVSAVRGADLFLCDCTHRVGRAPGHLSLEELAAHKSRLEARRILLTHLGPEMGRSRGARGFELARDGMRIRV
jgi:ribonuclease BN (tRNA processing enzyme)